jgi:HNH endonuclease
LLCSDGGHQVPRWHGCECTKAAPSGVSAARARAFRGHQFDVTYPSPGDIVEHMAVLSYLPCAYCGGPSNAIDHVVPLDGSRLKRGCGPGKSVVENLAAACQSCNSRESNRPLEEFLDTEFLRRSDQEGQDVALAWLLRTRETFAEQLTWPGCQKPLVSRETEDAAALEGNEEADATELDEDDPFDDLFAQGETG